MITSTVGIYANSIKFFALTNPIKQTKNIFLDKLKFLELFFVLLILQTSPLLKQQIFRDILS